MSAMIGTTPAESASNRVLLRASPAPGATGAKRGGVGRRRSGRGGPSQSRGGSLAVNAVALAFFVVMVFPVYWMVVTAFKPNSEIQSPTPTFFPLQFTLSHFADAIHKQYFWRYTFNSMVVSVATVAVATAVALCAALALCRFSFRGRRFFLVLIVVVQMVPLTALTIPLFIELRQLDLLNRLPGLVLAYVAFVLPFTIWMLRGFVQAVPADLEEAALVDGASRAQAFRRVILPLIVPGLVATSIFAFIQAWNQFLFPLVLMQQQSKYTLTVWLASFSTNRGTDFGGLMAGSALYTLPVLVLFLVIQRKVVTGLTAGAVKG